MCRKLGILPSMQPRRSQPSETSDTMFLMKRKALTACLTAVVIVTSASAHDLFLKLDTYILQPNSTAVVRLLNGTFQTSDGAVSRERMRDISIIGPGSEVPQREPPAWRDEGKTTVMELRTGAPGTYVVGISTKPREIALKAADFNNYLEHDGLPDILAARKKNNELGKDSRERYSKHVRAIFQVGDRRSDDYKALLNYPVEIIPQQNPYSLRPGQTISVLCLLEGRPLVNQFVIAGWESKDGKLPLVNTRTDEKGIARFKLSSSGKWFVKMIHMEPINEPSLNYESKWATLTFEIK